MSRTPGPASPRSWWSLIRAGRAAGDPGSGWAVETLGPLRRQTVECDVTRRVVARIVAEPAGPRPFAATPRISRLAWASSLLLAFSAIAFLGSTLLLLVRGGDEGVHQVVGLGLWGSHLFVLFGRLVAELGARAVAAALPILRAAWALLEVAAPLLRGTGLVVAAGGVLSILFSTYVFASARKTAPRVDFQGGTR